MLCAHRDDQSHLEQQLVHALRLLRDLNFELRLLGLHERLRPARHFEGQILHVDFLDAERRLLHIAHQDSDRGERARGG